MKRPRPLLVRYPKPEALAAVGHGHAVVEASAGTGKTYLIEHLFVDRVLEGDPVESVVVVTFTEKATAELQIRIRAKLGELAALGSEDEMARAARERPEDACWTIDDQARRRLRRALTELDRATITTIHAFCQRILTENAFFGGRLLRQQPIDEGEAFRVALLETLRRDLASDPAAAPFLEEALRRWGLERLASRFLRPSHDILRATHPPRADALLPRPLDTDALRAAVRGWIPVAEDDARMKAALKQAGVSGHAITGMMGRLSALGGAIADHGEGHPARLLGALDQAADDDVYEWILSRLPNASTGPAGAVGAAVRAAVEALARAATPLPAALTHVCLPHVVRHLEARKAAEGLYDFQDMLVLVARALADEGSGGRTLLAGLRARWRRAFIDEFQDTDEIQWSIFRRIFFEAGPDHALVVVGDPKQAIYGFRGADVHTYLRARREITAAGGASVPLRSTNRSGKPLTDALNLVLRADGKFPIFNWDSGIRYAEPVTSARPALRIEDAAGSVPRPLRILRMRYSDEKAPTWQVKRALMGAIVAEIRSVIDPARPLFLRGGRSERPLGPGDVFVLTRTNRESLEVGTGLRAAGIPFAFYKQDGLYQTVEAGEVLDLLRAVLEPRDRTARDRAWITPFFDLALPDLAACDDPPADHPLMAPLLRWRALADAGEWDRLFTSMVADSGVVARDLFRGEGERRLTNVQHVLEALHDEASRSRATLREIVDTLGAWVAGARLPFGDRGNVQRLETDAEAVQIMNMHKAKGLEAAVVMLFGGLWHLPGDDVLVFHDAEGLRRAQIGKRPGPAASQHAREREDEDRRLYYVALTRARGRLCVPFFGGWKQLRGAYKYVNDRLRTVLDEPDAAEAIEEVGFDCPGPPPIERAPAPPARVAGWRPPPDLLATPAAPPSYREAADGRAGFIVTSYTALRRIEAARTPLPPEPDDRASEASDDGLPGCGGGDGDPDGAPALPPGRATGIFLHELLERVDLGPLAQAPDREAWTARSDVLSLATEVLRRHDRPPAHVAPALDLVHAALATPVLLGDATVPALAAVPCALREMEFLFPLPERAHPLLGGAGGAGTAGPAGRPPFRIQRGVVRGFVDLFFEYDSRAYVCDWKSDSLPSWDAARLAAHCDDHYGLQERLYTIAALRALGIRDAGDYDRRFGGVVYAFLRGRRPAEPASGIFHRRSAFGDVVAWERAMAEPGWWGAAPAVRT